MRRAVAALVVTVVAVVLLAGYDTRPPRTFNPSSALLERDVARAVAEERFTMAAEPARRSGTGPGPGRRTADGELLATPFSAIQVRATLTGGRLTGIETLLLTGDGPHTDALNARAEPVLREEALRTGGADIDVVSGATSTSQSWIDSLESAIARARG